MLVATAPVTAMGLREATVDDLPQIVAMGRAFREAHYAEFIVENVPRMETQARALIEGESSLLLVAEGPSGLVGMIGMMLFPHFLSGELVAGELFWWVDPDHRGFAGLRLLKQAEKWAVEHGAARIQMIAPTLEVGRIYRRLGYQWIETGFQKTV